jgi:hypothetical protein
MNIYSRIRSKRNCALLAFGIFRSAWRMDLNWVLFACGLSTISSGERVGCPFSPSQFSCGARPEEDCRMFAIVISKSGEISSSSHIFASSRLLKSLLRWVSESPLHCLNSSRCLYARGARVWRIFRDRRFIFVSNMICSDMSIALRCARTPRKSGEKGFSDHGLKSLFRRFFEDFQGIGPFSNEGRRIPCMGCAVLH